MQRIIVRSMRMALALAMAAALWAAQPAGRVNDVIALVRTGMAEKRSDSQIAKDVHKAKLEERLEDQTIEELESEGAGAKTVEELVWLRDHSRELPPPTAALPFKHAPRPGIEEQRAMLAEARRTALAYASSLPDFMCTEVIHRYTGEGTGWGLKDTLHLKLTYFENHEEYKLLTLNGHATGKSYQEVGGSISEGEFGSILLQVFELRSAAQFRWDHWTTLRKREVQVLSYRVTPEHSTYHLAFGYVGQGGRDSTVVGQHGFVYIDRETNRVLRASGPYGQFPSVGFPLSGARNIHHAGLRFYRYQRTEVYCPLARRCAPRLGPDAQPQRAGVSGLSEVRLRCDHHVRR